MTKEDYERISNKLGLLGNVPAEYLNQVLKMRQIEVLENVSKRLLSIEESIGNLSRKHGWSGR